MAKRRRVPKDKASGVPKKYLSGITGTQRTQLARVIKQISTLYAQGKNIPQSLINRRMKLGQRKK